MGRDNFVAPHVERIVEEVQEVMWVKMNAEGLLPLGHPNLRVLPLSWDDSKQKAQDVAEMMPNINVTGTQKYLQ